MLGHSLDDEGFGSAVVALAQAHRRRRRTHRASVTAEVGASYAIDLVVLAMFWRGGAASAALLAAYAGAASLHLVLFGTLQFVDVARRASHREFGGWQMGWAIALQLLAMVWAPALAGYFVGVIFVVFSFGALFLSRRSALWMWVGTSCALALLLWHFPHMGAIPPQLRASAWVRGAAALGFSSLLLRCLVLNLRAVTLRARSEREAAALAAQAAAAHDRASHDALTGALNRDGLTELLWRQFDRLRGQGADHCVAMIDIDWFKSINDDCGHLTGDRVLCALVDLLQSRLRVGDRLARFGGEEFVLVMPDTTEHDALDVAERLRRTVQTNDWSGLAPGLLLTVSIGVAQAHASDSIDTLLQRADTALYGAKASGRNRCCVAMRVDAMGLEPMHA